MNDTPSQATQRDLTKKIGRRLRAARQAQGLSLSGLSSLTGTLSKSRISNYEQGIRRMGIEQAQELASALVGVTPTYLLCLEDSDPLSEDERGLVERFRRADPRGREAILTFAEAASNRSPGGRGGGA